MLRAGLIGFPSTGKTTLFELLSRKSGKPSKPRSGKNETNTGIANVPDNRLDRLNALFNPEKHVPAPVVFSDIIGASNPQNLIDVAPYREANALLHVVRAFRAAEVPHVAGTIDPYRDARTMEDELILADLAVTERRLERIKKDKKKGATKALELESNVLSECKRGLEHGEPIRTLSFEALEYKTLRGFQFLSAKPLLLIINLDESDVQQAENAVELTKLTEIASSKSTKAVPVFAKIELEISQLDPNESPLFLEDLGLKETGLDRIIQATYDLLGYISFFTVGKDECRAWSIPKGITAPEAAAEIHSDIQQGFIRAEVVRYEDLILRGSMNECRDHGEVRLEGKEYVVEDGDIINFRFAK